MIKQRLVYMVALGVAGLTLLAALADPFAVRRVHTDQTYHALVAQQFVRAGGIATHDFWESLPEGRQHIYPPAYHLLLSIFVHLGADGFTLIYGVSIISLALFFVLFWHGVSLLFDRQTASFCVIVFCLLAQFTSMVATTTPSLLVLAASPYLIYLWQRGAYRGMAALFVIMAYAHLYMPWLVLAGLLAYALVHRRDSFKQTIVWFGLAIVAYSPWLIHVLIGRGSIKYFTPQTVTDVAMFGIPLLVLGAFIVYTLTLVNRWNMLRHDPAVVYWFIVLASLPIAFSAYPYRFWENIFVFGGVLCWSTLLRTTPQSVRVSWMVIGVLLVASPVIYVSAQQPARLAFSWSTPAASIQRLMSDRVFNNDLLRFPHYSRPHVQLAESVRSVTSEQDAIFVDIRTLGAVGYLAEEQYRIGQLFGALSGRPMVNARHPEYFFRPQVALADARVIITDRQLLEPSLELIDQRAGIFAYKNQSGKIVSPVPQWIIPFWFAYSLLGALLALVIQEIIHTKKST